MWEKILKINKLISNISASIAVIMLLLACIVVTEMVYIRYVLEGSTVWETEFVMYSIVASTLLGSPYVLLTQGHVKIDIVPNSMGNNKWILELLSSLISLTFVMVLAFTSWEYFLEAYSKNWLTETVWAPPLWIPLLSLVIGMTFLCIQVILNICSLLAFKKCVFIKHEEGL